jgi:hypothetical protein
MEPEGSATSPVMLTSAFVANFSLNSSVAFLRAPLCPLW